MMRKRTRNAAPRFAPLRPLAAIIAAFTLTAADAPDFSPGTRVAFIACPMVRDTYIPAWLSEYRGELFYLGPQGDLGAHFYPPQLGHKALVEGVVAEGERISGGLPLEPVHVSVLPELDVTCNTILPALAYADPPHHRTPGPSNSVEEEEEPRQGRGATTEQAPGTPRELDVRFAFDVGERLFLRDTLAVRRAAELVGAGEGAKVSIIGYRAGAVLSDGETVEEGADIGERRARMVRGMLVHAGVPEDAITVSTHDAVAELDGIDDHELRIVRLRVQP